MDLLVVRPVKGTDIDAFIQLVEETPYGLSSLPKNRDFLEERIAASQFTFMYNPKKPSGGNFLFVLEDLKQGRLIGSCGIVSKVGGFEPFYAYNIETVRKYSENAGVDQLLKVLQLHRDHSGPCEIGSLFLLPEYRQKGFGRFLSLSRFLFMAQFPGAFDPRVVAKLRGVITEDGRSPFWEGVGRHFFKMDFAEADYLCAINKEVLGELMPAYPIYIDLLPQASQDAIGQVDPQTIGAKIILERQGFKHCDMVDLFEAGPIMQAPLKSIHAVSQSEKRVIREIKRMPNDPIDHIVSNTRLYFRASFGTVELVDDEVILPIELADALQVDVGETVRLYPVKL